MEALAQFIKSTKQLESLLEKGLPAEEREPYLEQVNGLLEERQQYLQLLPNLTSLKDDTKAELAKLESKIQDLMAQQKNVIKQDLQLLQEQKKKTTKYADPYGDFSIDGMYLDKKK